MKRASLVVILCVVLAQFAGPSRKVDAHNAASNGALPQTGLIPDPALAPASASEGQFTPLSQTPSLFSYEARTVYLTNLERRKAGVPPLRWNRELTLASRWFAWDSIENRPAGWIGHQDSQGGWPGDRALAWGYRGGAGAENAGWSSWLLSPEDAVQMWMDSPGHRDNLLSPGHAEIGVGYYSLGARDATYMVQGFGSDAVSPPLILENEAPNTSSRSISLYQHAPASSGGLTGIGPAVDMMVSSSGCFDNGSWQGYQAESSYTLPAGEGWKTVHSKIRDRLGRTSTTSDSIYLGASLPGQTLDLGQLASQDSAVTLHGLDGGSLNRAQFSLGWLADDSSADFKKWWGNGETVANDPGAVGNTAYRMFDGDGETMAWITSYGFLNGSASYVAYFRLKTNDNSSGGEISRIAVEANGVTTARSLRGADFRAPGQYQEFAVPFTYDNNASDPWLKLMVWRSGSADIYYDDVSVFTAPTPFTSTYTLSVPGENYRGQGVWVRYSNDSNSSFTPYSEARTAVPLSVSSQQVTLMAEPGEYSRYTAVSVNSQCGGWSVAQAPGWLDTSSSAGQLRMRGTENATGTYTGSVVLQGETGNTVSVPVRMLVVNNVSETVLPLIIGQ